MKQLFLFFLMGITYRTLVWEDKLNNIFNVFFDKEKREKRKKKKKKKKKESHEFTSKTTNVIITHD